MIAERTTTRISGSRDFFKLQDLLGGLQGQPCFQAEVSYAGQPVLHFGKGVPWRTSKAKGVRGEWIIDAVASPWFYLGAESEVPLLSDRGIRPDDTSRNIVLAHLEGKKVDRVGITPQGDILIRMEDGGTWGTMAYRDPEPDAELSMWEILMPEDRFVSVSALPDPNWSLKPASEPCS